MIILVWGLGQVRQHCSTGDNAAKTAKLMDIGPIRHPRPVTVADLHLELEKEQEAVVRLKLYAIG